MIINKRSIFRLVASLAIPAVLWDSTSAETTDKTGVLTTSALKRYVAQFNADDEEIYANVPNSEAFAFLEKNVPLFECPDEGFERTFYFRWWTYRKHVKETPDGYVIKEFVPKVTWLGKPNTISCLAGHRYYEGRRLHNPRFLDDYSVFWLRKGGQPRRYSFWIADAHFARHMVTPNAELITNLLKNYEAWEKSHLSHEDFLFHQIDDLDGMEVSITATSVTLAGLANLLNNYEQNTIGKEAYLETLRIYSKSHQRTRKDGKDYNHSTYNGLIGLRPRMDDVVAVNLLLPEDTWDYFCLDHVLYHGHMSTVVWSKTGEKYKKEMGLGVFPEGKKIAGSPNLSKVTGKLKKSAYHPCYGATNAFPTPPYQI